MDEQMELKLATTQWQREVDREATDLIEAGIPPYEANEKAVLIVSRRRKEKNADKSGS